VANPYLPIFALGLLAFLFACVSVTLATVVGPKRYNRAKRDAYECGVDPTPQPIGGGHFSVKYYHLRYRDCVPLPVGGFVRRIRVVRSNGSHPVHRDRDVRVPLRLAPRWIAMGLAAMTLDPMNPIATTATPVTYVNRLKAGTRWA
jgi:hypothetical protein